MSDAAATAKALQQLKRDIGPEGMRDIFVQTGKNVAALARSYAPSETGALRRSIGYRTTGNGVIIESGRSLSRPYDFYQEYGTTTTPAVRFMDRAAQQYAKTTLLLIERRVDQGVSKFG